MKNRKDKIKVLSGIKNGTRSKDEIPPENCFLMVDYSNHDPVYRNRRTGEIYTMEQLDKLKHRYTIILTRDITGPNGEFISYEVGAME